MSPSSQPPTLAAPFVWVGLEQLTRQRLILFSFFACPYLKIARTTGRTIDKRKDDSNIPGGRKKHIRIALWIFAMWSTTLVVHSTTTLQARKSVYWRPRCGDCCPSMGIKPALVQRNRATNRENYLRPSSTVYFTSSKRTDWTKIDHNSVSRFRLPENFIRIFYLVCQKRSTNNTRTVMKTCRLKNAFYSAKSPVRLGAIKYELALRLT